MQGASLKSYTRFAELQARKHLSTASFRQQNTSKSSNCSNPFDYAGAACKADAVEAFIWESSLYISRAGAQYGELEAGIGNDGRDRLAPRLIPSSLTGAAKVPS